MSAEALSLLERFPDAKVLCVGDVMLDRYIYGHASRISPEAPVPVVHVRRQALVPGGVGNVANNLTAWGVATLPFSVTGDDLSADALANLPPFGGGEDLVFLRDPGRPTIVKTRVIAGIQQVVRFDDENPEPIADGLADQLAAAMEKRLDAIGAVAVSDYAKGVVTLRLMRRILELAARHGKPVVVDPKGHDYSKYSGADLVKPNRKELAEAVGLPSLKSDREVAEAARSLIRRFDIKNILVTLSEHGMMLVRRDDTAEAPVMLPSRAREVYDVSGAGDTVLAAMAASMAAGAPLDVGARLAMLAAAVVVGKVGTAVAHPDEIRAAARAV